MRRHPHKYNLRSKSSDDGSDEEEEDDGCLGCRHTAPYCATKLLHPDSDKKEREVLVQKLQTSPFFRGVITSEHPTYSKVGRVLPDGISIVAIYRWLDGNYHSLHYFILINLGGKTHLHTFLERRNHIQTA